MQISIGMNLVRGLGGESFNFLVLYLDEQGQAIEDDETAETYWVTTDLEEEATDA